MGSTGWRTSQFANFPICYIIPSHTSTIDLANKCSIHRRRRSFWQSSVRALFSSFRATRLALHTILEFITFVIFWEQYEPRSLRGWNSFFSHLFHPTSIRISTFSDTFNLCSLSYDTFYKWPPFWPSVISWNEYCRDEMDPTFIYTPAVTSVVRNRNDRNLLKSSEK